MNIRLDDRRIDPQPATADDLLLAGDLHQPLQEALEHTGVDQPRQPDQCLGIRHPLAVDPTERSVHEAAAHLALAFVETPVVEVLQDQHTKDDVGRGAEPAAAPAQRVAAFQRLGDQLDKSLVLERGIDSPQRWIPELVAVGQEHLEDTALAMRATDHGTSGEGSRLRCALGDIVAVHNITDDDDAVAMNPSTKLRVRTPSAARAPRKQRAKALTSAPESN